ncbi:hypothetical protein ACN20G_14715 [Streptomyces sp. BI20]|uniref:hypothetical protein n=1 Tax=Streptomyces sp. BI20 TaxID=3403460 RepID=UPI003C772252
MFRPRDPEPERETAPERRADRSVPPTKAPDDSTPDEPVTDEPVNDEPVEVTADSDAPTSDPDAEAERATGERAPAEDGRVADPAEAERTAVFRMPRPKPAAEDSEPAPAAAEDRSTSGSASDRDTDRASGRDAERDADRAGAGAGASDAAVVGSSAKSSAKTSDEPARGSASGRAPVVDPRLGVARPGASASESASGSDSGSERGEEPKPLPASERTAVFRTVRKDPARDGNEDADGGTGGGTDGDAPADRDRRTAVFRTLRRDPSGTGDTDTDTDTDADADRDAPEPEVERTTVFRAIRRDDERPASRPGTFVPLREDADLPRPVSASEREPKGEVHGTRRPAGSDATGEPENERAPRAGKDAEPAKGETAAKGAKPANTPNTPNAPKGEKGEKGTKEEKGEKGTKGAAGAERSAPSAAASASPSAPPSDPPRPGRVPPPGGAGRVPPPTSGPYAARPGTPDETQQVSLHGPERTTQQPLPPLPPLDMLAQLTNNPPPPPSAMRSTVRRIKIYGPILTLIVLVLAVVQAFRPLPAPTLVATGKTSFTFEGGKPELTWPASGQAVMAASGLGVIGSSGEPKPVPIASVTKSMTAYIIMRDHPFKKGEPGKMIDIDQTAEDEGKKNNSTDNESTLDTVQAGQKISEHDAIAALMIPSANNIARLLARWDSGSQEAFVKKMNDTAKELGMTNTTYTDPSGLDATTVSTAEDQVKLGLKLVEIDALMAITKLPTWTDPSGKTWRNWNALVPYDDSLGIKTGTTTKAGGNLLFAAKKKVGDTEQLLVGAVLAQHKAPIIDTVVDNSRKLLVSTQKSLVGATVVKKGQVVGYVDDGLGGRTPLVTTKDVTAVGWPSLTVSLKLGTDGKPLVAEAASGTEVGVLTVGEGASRIEVPVAVKGELSKPGLFAKLTRLG